ncbi:flagellar assembly protein FliH [Marinobacter sp. F4206]|uniref:flagellar assembly protein FliH n=1 Tax=Marinobacter sp. F4206 TaxID=2861777 RepID=UPI001C5FB85A|nr:flagellar assembly protein FliH [Marinobacter sp. F4206]MBW4933715.1 flagellar assembly protein FliH [Marinobacter sp. F4206]
MKDSTKDLNRIPKEQLTAYERWELPLLDGQGNEVAREEERNVKPLTAADISEIRRAAREDGFNEGREEGYQAGLAEGREQGHEEGLQAGKDEGREQGEKKGYEDTRKEMDTRLDRLEHLMGELLLPIRRHEDEIEGALVNLTTVLARAVVFRELTIDSSQIRSVVRRALEALPSTAENLRVHIHPDDGELVREVTARLETQASIIEDDDVLPGGCRVETRHSLVDFTVEKRFQRAVQSMLEQQSEEAVAAEAEDVDALMGDLTDFQRDVLNSTDAGEAVESGHPDESGDDRGEGDDLTSG